MPNKDHENHYRSRQEALSTYYQPPESFLSAEEEVELTRMALT